MTFIDPTLLLLGQLSEHLAQMPAQTPIQQFSAALRYNYNVLPALRRPVTQALVRVHPDSPLSVSGGSQLRFSRIYSRKCQTAIASPVEPAELPIGLAAATLR